MTFWYWDPRRDTPDIHNDELVYLDLDTRKDLNSLVRQLNTLISDSVSQVVSDLGTSRIHFVDMTTHFNNRRWCEWYVDEPDEDREDTYLFLSGWKDFWPDGYALDQDNADIAELQAHGQVPVPSADTCEGNLGANPDLYDIFLCFVAQDMQRNSSGPAATHVNAANAAIASGDYGSADIPWFMPTRTIKTFHPRSWGHAGMRSAVLVAMQSNGQYLLSIPDDTDAGDQQ